MRLHSIRKADTIGRSLQRFSGLLLILAALLLVLARSTVAPELTAAGRRVALVIGNSAYRNVARLANPSNDASLVARTLRSLGFKIVGGQDQRDLDKFHFDRAIQNFGDQIRGADVALFYYAGHGVQVRGSNYLVPVDANPTRESDVDFQFVNSEAVLHQMEDAKTRLNLVILDACRNNPFGGRGLRALGGGLAQMQAPEGTLVSYATQPGNIARDGDNDDSPFTLALVHQIQQPGYDIFRVFNQIGLEVEHETRGEQRPWVSTSPIYGDFYFAGPPAEPLSIASGVPDADVVFWQSIEGSRDAADYQSYLNEFPNGRFAPLARSRIARYEPASSRVGGISSSLPSPSTASVSARPSAANASPTSNPASPHAGPAQLALAKATNSIEEMPMGNHSNFILIGESLEKTDADLLVKRFERFGYHPKIITAGSRPNRYSLKFGPYSPADAAKTHEDLLQRWHDLTFHLMVNSPAGALMDQSTANGALEAIRRLGTRPLLVSREVNGQAKYQVEIGPFVTQKEAMQAGTALGEKYSDSLNCPWGNCDWQYTWTGSPPRLLCKDPGRSCDPDN
jgi:hypothetical protein